MRWVKISGPEVEERIGDVLVLGCQRVKRPEAGDSTAYCLGQVDHTEELALSNSYMKPARSLSPPQLKSYYAGAYHYKDM